MSGSDYKPAMLNGWQLILPDLVKLGSVPLDVAVLHLRLGCLTCLDEEAILIMWPDLTF